MADAGQVIAALRGSVLGEIVEPSSPEYDGARRVWNGMIDRRPAAVVRATGAADVIATIRAAREADLPLAIRSGGHSVAGLSTCDGGIVLDLTRLRGVRVDPEARTAQVAGGTLLGEMDHETMAFGLATTSGTVAHTGVAGLTLGGGLGRLHRKHGLSIDNLLSVDVVTADGRVVRAAEDENPDLFWAIRGAGANFGVVTRFEFRLHPLSPITYGAIAVHDVERAPEVLAFFREYTATLPDEMAAVASIQTATPHGPFPPELHGRQVLVTGGAYLGDGGEEAAARLTEPLRTFGTPLFQMLMPAPYLMVQKMMDEAYAWGRRYYVKGGYLEELSDDAITALVGAAQSAPSAGAEVAIMTLGGAMARVPEEATAFTGRLAPFFADIEVAWEEPSEDERMMTWGRAAMRSVDPYLLRANYVNALGDEAEDVVRAAYGDEKYKKLAELKGIWDPDNVFRQNSNIRPHR